MVKAPSSVLGVLSALLVAPVAHAEATGAELSWSAPEGCPSGEQVKLRAERILGRPLSTSGRMLTVTAVVTPPGETQPWTVTLEQDTSARRTSRTLQAASCDELANAAALFVAILIEPHMAATEPGEDSASVAATEEPAQSSSKGAKTSPANPALQPHDATASRFALGGSTGVRSALVPRLAFGLGLQASFSYRALRTSAGVSFWLPVKKTVDEDGALGAELQLSTAHGKVCLQLVSGSLVPALCAGAELAVLRGRGFGPGVEPTPRTAVFGSALAGPTLVWRASERLGVLCEGDWLLPLGVRRFVLGGSAPAAIYAPEAGFRLACGAEWAL